MSALVEALSGALIAPASAGGTMLVLRMFGVRTRHRIVSLLRGWKTGCAAGGVSALIIHDWPFAAGAGGSLVVAITIWWWRRRKRRNATMAMGAKSRERRDKLVRRTRETSRPRHALRPVPHAS